MYRGGHVKDITQQEHAMIDVPSGLLNGHNITDSNDRLPSRMLDGHNTTESNYRCTEGVM